MKITRIEKREIETSILDAMQCDNCGKIYKDIMEIQEFLYIKFQGGYGSIFGDGDTIESDICQYCLIKWLEGKYRITESQF